MSDVPVFQGEPEPIPPVVVTPTPSVQQRIIDVQISRLKISHDTIKLLIPQLPENERSHFKCMINTYFEELGWYLDDMREML